MSALGQKRTHTLHQPMSALPPKADICSALSDVRFGPKADIHSIALFVASTLIDLDGLNRTLRSRVSVSFLSRFELFAEVGLLRTKLANSFIEFVVEPLKEPCCVCRGCKEHGNEDHERLFH
jgi:hypothetical protein